MNTIKLSIPILFLGAALLITQTMQAAEAETYQVTGPVLELTPTMIVVQKGQDKWQIARGSAKVTIEYQMMATEIEVKGAKQK